MKRTLLVGLFSTFLLINHCLFSATFTWRGSSTDWFNQSNWDSGDGSPGNDGIPTSTDDVIIPFKIRQPLINTGNAICRNLTIMADDASTITLRVSGGVLSVHGKLTLTSFGHGDPDPDAFVARLLITGGRVQLINNDLIFFEAEPSSTADPSKQVLEMQSAGTLWIAGNIWAVDFEDQDVPTGTIICTGQSAIRFTNNGLFFPVTDYTYYNNIQIGGFDGRTASAIVRYNALDATHLTGNITVFSLGTFIDNGFSLTGLSDKIFQINSGGVANFSSPTGLPQGMANVFSPGSTVVFSGGNQNISAASFDILNIAGTGDKTLIGDITVASQLNLTSGSIITGSNAVSVANTAASSVSYTGNNRVIGNLRRMVGEGIPYQFNVGTSTALQRLDINFSDVADHEYVSVNFNTAAPGNNIPTEISIGEATFSEMVPFGFWSIEGDGSSDPTYNLSLYPSFSNTEGYKAFTILTRENASTPWGASGDPHLPSNVAEDGSVLEDGMWADNSVRRTGMIGFSDKGVAGSMTELPVHLVDYKVTLIKDYVNLDWATLSESNSSHFEIQRSRDSKTFETIGSVQSAGNSSDRIEYNYKDYTATDIFAEKLYYRLKQIDVNGQYKIYPMQVVNVGGIIRDSKILIHPNPASEFVKVISFLKEDIQLQVFTPQGNKVAETTIGGNETTLNTSKYKQGVYVFKFVSGSTVMNKKVIVQ